MRRVWVFDIDGTLADCSHRLHHIEKTPKDWRAFFADVSADSPIDHVVRLCRALAADAGVAFISGRSDECREATLEWLSDHVGIAGARLYMRRAGDFRADDVIKVELLADMQGDGYSPIMVFDDRDRVVAAWRSVGIPCAQVAPGDF